MFVFFNFDFKNPDAKIRDLVIIRKENYPPRQHIDYKRIKTRKFS